MESIPRHPANQNRWNAIKLAGAAGLSLSIYALAFVRPAGFLRVYAPGQVFRDFLHFAPSATRWEMIVAFFLLAVIYVGGIKIARHAQGGECWVVVLVGSLAMGILLAYLFPLDASDLFNNIMNGRIRGVYGMNPFIQVANQFKQDRFFPLVSWSDVPSAYGPMWELMAAGVAHIAGEVSLTNFLLFKSLPGVFLLASSGVVAGILKSCGSQQVLAGTLLLAWNPVVLYETWGNGHNDIVMVFWILLAGWALIQDRPVWSVLALVAGGLVKFIPILLLPTAMVIALRSQRNWRMRFRFLALSGTLGIGLIVLTYSPFWEGIKVLSISRRAHLFTTSLPAVVYQLTVPGLDRTLSANLISTISLGLTLGVSLWQAWRTASNKSRVAFFQTAFHILAFYLLVTCLWFQQWYTIWLIGLAPVIEPGITQIFALVFGFSALSKQFFLFPLLIWPNPRPPQPGFEIKFALGVLGIPWLFAGVILCKQKISHLLVRLPLRLRAQKTL